MATKAKVTNTLIARLLVAICRYLTKDDVQIPRYMRMAIADGEQAVKWEPPAYEQRKLSITTTDGTDGGCVSCCFRGKVTQFVGTDPYRRWVMRMCDECLQELVNWYNNHEK